MAETIKQEKFQEKTTIILNDVAEVILKWNLGKMANDEAMNKINKAVMFSPSGKKLEIAVPYEEFSLYILDRAIFEKTLAHGVKSQGGDIKLGRTVTGLIKKDKRTIGLSTTKEDIFAKIIIGADGVEGRIGEGSSLGCQFFGQIANLKNSDKAKSEIGGARLQARIGVRERNLLNLEAQLYQERLKLGGNRRRYLISFISLSDEFLLFGLYRPGRESDRYYTAAI